MELAEQLKKETEKWLRKIEKVNFSAKTKKGQEYKNNIEAYIKDSKHFLKKKDFIRGFESIIWAWAFLEISQELSLLEITP